MKSDFYAEIIKKIKTRNPYIKIALDADEEFLNKGGKSSPDLIKPNLYELERLTKTRLRDFSQFFKTGKNLINSGIQYVLVTLGEKGAVGFSKTGVFWSKPPGTMEKSSVGCGDVFLSGFLHKISSGTDFEKSLQFAVACGTAKVKEEGTKMPPVPEVQKILKETSIISCQTVPYELKKLFRLKGSG
ncbi:MAG: PfkB family carbohydrate kinase [Candidatus Omnitrophica bacterium]|nr:PfkB family carbohydrate kinase [Candidatus Omnitrophota bacterium]